MIWAHFGPGLVARLPIPDPLGDLLLSLGRIATPAFAAIFGVTLGLVYLPKYLEGDRQGVTHRLLRRASTLGLCTLIVALPNFLTWNEAAQAQSLPWMFKLYSVLFFYTIALITVPVLLRLIAPRPNLLAPLYGIASFCLLVWIRDDVWPEGTSGIHLEFVRLVFFSGKYAYFLMMGTVAVTIPIGLSLRRLSRGDAPPSRFAWWGIIAMAGPLLGLGRYLAVSGGLRELPAVLNQDITSVWYHLCFGSLGLVLVFWFEMLNRGFPRWLVIGMPLALLGQCALEIYAMHVYVLPTLHAMDHVYEIEGPLRATMPLLLFVLGCGIILRRKVARTAHRPISIPSTAR